MSWSWRRWRPCRAQLPWRHRRVQSACARSCWRGSEAAAGDVGGSGAGEPLMWVGLGFVRREGARDKKSAPRPRRGSCRDAIRRRQPSPP